MWQCLNILCFSPEKTKVKFMVTPAYLMPTTNVEDDDNGDTDSDAEENAKEFIEDTGSDAEEDTEEKLSDTDTDAEKMPRVSWTLFTASSLK